MKRNTVVFIAVVLVVTGMLIVAVHQARQRRAAGPSLSVNAVGSAAPDFELQALDGRTVKLSDYRGKAVLLNFWATWCPPCKIEIPWFVDLQKQYASQGLEVIGVAMDDEGKAKVEPFAKEMKIDYTLLIGNDKVADLYGGVEALPMTFYIGRDGKIVKRVAGLISHSEIEDNVQAALKEGQPAGAKTASAAVGAAQGAQ